MYSRMFHVKIKRTIFRYFVKINKNMILLSIEILFRIK